MPKKPKAHWINVQAPEGLEKEEFLRRLAAEGTEQKKRDQNQK